MARLRIFNPDGSEAELSGNGAREAVLYLRRHGWTDADSFAIQTAGGRHPPADPSETECAVDMGRARLQSAGYPSGAEDGRGELAAGGRTWRFQHVQVGNPQCAIRVENERELDALDLPRDRPRDRAPRAVPQPDQRVVVRRARARAASARGSSSAGWGRRRRAEPAPPAAAVAYVLDGGSSPVTVVLDGGELGVEVGDDLQIKLSGWAVPVYRGTLAEDVPRGVACDAVADWT